MHRSGLGRPGGESLQLPIDFPANPGIGGGILNLLRGEMVIGPVGRSCRFGDTDTANHGRQSSESVIFNPLAPGDSGQIDKPLWLEGLYFLQTQQVEIQGNPGFDNGRIGKDGQERFRQCGVLQLEEEHLLMGCQLEEAWGKFLSFFEGGPCFRIKSQQRRQR